VLDAGSLIAWRGAWRDQYPVKKGWSDGKNRYESYPGNLLGLHLTLVLLHYRAY
jgi:hypothetical protein